MQLTYKLSQHLVACILLISFLLQSCTHSLNPPLPATQQTEHIQSPLADNQLLSKQGHRVFFYQEEDQLQAEVIDKHSNVTYTLPVYVERDTDLAQVLAMPEAAQKRLIYVQLPSREREGLVWIGSAGLMGAGKRKGKEKVTHDEAEPEKKKTRREDQPSINDLAEYQELLSLAIKGNAEAQYRLGVRACKLCGKTGLSQQARQEAIYWLDKAAAQGHEEAIVLRKEIADFEEEERQVIQREIPQAPAGTSQSIEGSNLLNAAIEGDTEAQFQFGRRTCEEGLVWIMRAAAHNHRGAIEFLRGINHGRTIEDNNNQKILPLEIWAYILTYVPYPAILSCRLVNRDFYELITGDSRVGLVVAESKPTSISSYWWVSKDIDCRGLNPDETPSFAFYQLIKSVKNLPQSFCPYLPGSNIHTLNLKGNEIGVEGAAALAQVLAQSQVHTLILYYNNIGAEGAAALAQALAQSKVHTLNLDSNYIGDAGAKALAQVLAQSRVHTLDLGSNRIGDAGAAALAQVLVLSQVHTLDLGGNGIGEEGAAALAQVLAQSRIHTLDLYNNLIGAEGAAALAQVLAKSQVQYLHLGGSDIGAEGAAALAQVLAQSQVQYLHLGGNDIGDEGVEALAQVLAQSQVQILHLGFNDIGDEGAAALAQVLAQSQLHALDLYNNVIGAEGAAALAQVLAQSQVHTLDLEGNQIGDRGTQALAQVLAHSQIHTLDLSKNGIGDGGAQALASVLAHSQVHTLNLRDNRIGNEMQAILKEKYPQITWEF